MGGGGGISSMFLLTGDIAGVRLNLTATYQECGWFSLHSSPNLHVIQLLLVAPSVLLSGSASLCLFLAYQWRGVSDGGR